MSQGTPAPIVTWNGMTIILAIRRVRGFEEVRG